MFERWCETEGHTLYQMQTVRSILVEKGIETTKYYGRSCWKGLTWGHDAERLVRDVLGDSAWSAPPAAAGPRTAVDPDPPPF